MNSCVIFEKSSNISIILVGGYSWNVPGSGNKMNKTQPLTLKSFQVVHEMPNMCPASPPAPAPLRSSMLNWENVQGWSSYRFWAGGTRGELLAITQDDNENQPTDQQSNK